MTERVIRVTIDPATSSGAAKVQSDLKKIQSAAIGAQTSVTGIKNSLQSVAAGGGLTKVAQDALGVSKNLSDSVKQALGLSRALAGIKMPSFSGLGGGAGGIGGLFKGLVGGAAFTTLARDVTQYAQAVAGLVDEYSKMQNQLRLVTTDSENLKRVQAELYQLAQDTRSPLESTVTLYARIARNAAQLGLSQQDVLDVTKTVNQAIQVSGGTAAEASAGVVQFAQALASGRLQGDELRSILENMPRLATALADGLGVGIGELRKLGEQGELTSDKVIAALQKSAPGVAAEFEKLTPTIGSAFTVLRNSIVDTIGKLNETSGVGAAFAEMVIGLANYVTQFGSALSGTLQPQDEVSSGMQIFASAVLILYSALESLVTLITGTVTTAFTSVGDLIGGLAAAIVAALSGDFVRAKEIAAETFNDLGKNLQTGFVKTADELVSDMSKRIESLVELWDKGARDSAPARAALAGADTSKRKKEDTFNSVADEIRKDPLYNGDWSPTGLPMPDEFEIAGMTTDIEEESLKDIEKAADAAWDRIRYNMGQIKDQTSEYAKEAARNIQGAFADFLFDPFSEGLDGMLKGFLDTMRRIVAEALAAKAMQALGNMLSNSGNPYLMAAGAIIGGRAEGGNVQKGVPYMVNERRYQSRRPEIFVPNRSGKIMDQRAASQGQQQQMPAIMIVRDENEIPNVLASRRGKSALIQQVSTYPDEFRAALGLG